MEENELLRNGGQDIPLFVSQRRTRLTRGGVSHILHKYAGRISEKYPEMPKKLTPHVVRHSKAMHMYQAGVNLIYIRDILGHVDVATTDTYARADVEAKRKSLEELCPDLIPSVEQINDLPDWNKDPNLLNYLNNL
jgi:site-specific recombinase XerD